MHPLMERQLWENRKTPQKTAPKGRIPRATYTKLAWGSEPAQRRTARRNDGSGTYRIAPPRTDLLTMNRAMRCKSRVTTGASDRTSATTKSSDAQFA